MKKNWFYLLAFLIPFGAMLGICIANGVYPFGKNSFMHCDMYHQYVPFLVEFWRKLHAGGSLVQDWNLGLGTEFTAVFAYYLSTPTNWLVYFVPEKLIIEFMTFMILVKIGLCGPTFAYYLRSRFQTDSPMIFAFSTLYALSGFVAAYNWNHMWLDVIWIAPLVLLGLERLVKEGKCRLYCLALAASIFTNYYLSVMLCIFLVFYFGVLLFTSGLKWKEKGAAILNFGVYSLLGGGMVGALLIPVMIVMRATGFDDSTFPQKLEFYFNGLEVLTRHFLTIPKEIGLDHWPNVYCGIAVFFLIPMYLLCRQIPLKQRIVKVLFAAFLMLSFSTNVLNFLWHGFNYPNSLPARQSYLYIFLLLTMGFEVVQHIKSWKIGWFSVATAIGTVVMALCSIFVTTDGFTVRVAAISWCFFGLYIVLGVMQFLMPKRRKVLMWIVIALLVGESVTNMAVTSVPVVTRNYYMTKWENYENLLEKARDRGEAAVGSAFYRFQSFCYMTKNDGMLAGYPGISVFSSTTNSSIKDLYNRMGLEGTKVSYYSEGTTALTAAMLGVRYTFSEQEEGEELYTLVAESGNMKLYENKYTLPVGFGMTAELAEEFESIIRGSNSNNLQAQNKLGTALGISGQLFHYQGKGSELKVKQDGYYYAYISGDAGETVIMTEIIGDGADEVRKFDKLKSNALIEIGSLKKGTEWKFTSEENEEKKVQAWVYRLDFPVLEQAIAILGESPFQVTGYGDGFMDGSVNMATDGKLLLSIPADGGWIITVDGVEAETERWMDAFISIPLTAGDHEISLQYKVQGLGIGVVVSAVCIGLFVFLEAYKAKKKDAEVGNEESETKENAQLMEE